MDQQRLRALDHVLGWFGFGLEFSADGNLKPPGRSGQATTLQSYASERDPAEIQTDDPLQVLRVALPAAAEIARAETKHAVDVVAERFPRLSSGIGNEATGGREPDPTAIAPADDHPAKATGGVETEGDAVRQTTRSVRSTTKENFEASLEVIGEAAEHLAERGDQVRGAIRAFGATSVHRLRTVFPRSVQPTGALESPRPVSLVDQTSPVSTVNVETTPQVVTSQFVPVTPEADAGSVLNDGPTEEREEHGADDVSTQPPAAPSWTERLLDLSGRVGARSGFGSKTPPSILSYDPAILKNEPDGTGEEAEQLDPPSPAWSEATIETAPPAIPAAPAIPTIDDEVAEPLASAAVETPASAEDLAEPDDSLGIDNSVDVDVDEETSATEEVHGTHDETTTDWFRPFDVEPDAGDSGSSSTEPEVAPAAEPNKPNQVESVETFTLNEVVAAAPVAEETTADIDPPSVEATEVVDDSNVGFKTNDVTSESGPTDFSPMVLPSILREVPTTSKDERGDESEAERFRPIDRDLETALERLSSLVDREATEAAEPEREEAAEQVEQIAANTPVARELADDMDSPVIEETNVLEQATDEVFVAPTWRERLLDLPGLRHLSGRSDERTPQPVLTDDEIEESRAAVVARLERMLAQDAGRNGDPPHPRND